MLIDFYKLMQPCRIEYVFWLCGINWCWSPLVNIESELRNSLFKEFNYVLIVKPSGFACPSIIVAFRFLKSSWKARSWSFTNGKEMYLTCWKMFVISSTCFQRLITKNSISCGFSIIFRCYAVLITDVRLWFVQHWSRDEKNRCLKETTKAFRYMGQIVRLIVS